MQDPNKTTNNSTEYSKQGKTGTKISNSNISKIQLNKEDSLAGQVNYNSNYNIENPRYSTLTSN